MRNPNYSSVDTETGNVSYNGALSLEKGDHSHMPSRSEAYLPGSEKTAVVNGQVGDRPTTFTVRDSVTYPDGHTESIHHSFTNESYADQSAWNEQAASLPETFDAPNPGDELRSIDILKNIPINYEVHMLSNDAFTLGEADRSVLMNTFPVRIYTRHDNMTSCSHIECLCGQIDVVKHSSTVTVDKRLFRANSAWDMLLGTNRTETTIANAPTKEYRFRKEIINTMYNGIGIIDYAGNKVMFSFV